MKLTIVWLDLNFKDGNIFLPTSGKIPKKTQSELLITSWLFLVIIILFLNFFFKDFDLFLFLGEINIFLEDILELQIPVITSEEILPIPIKPSFIGS